MAADRDRFLLAKEGNEDALNELVEEHAGLVYAVAERFLHRGQEKEDLVQIGMIGLMKAIRGFDPEFGVKFSTYAVPVIMGEIRSFFRDDGIVKVSRKIRQQRRCIEKSVESLEQRFHRPPTLSEISEETGLSIEEIGLAKEASIVICPIEGEVDSGGENAKQQAEKTFRKLLLDVTISQLPETERRLIGMRFYLDMSQSQVAQRLHVSQASVSRMEKKALKDLRRRLE